MFAIGDKKWAGLSKLIEEAGEVIQVSGKLMGSRGEIEHWSGNLDVKFIEELADLRAAIDFFISKNFSDVEYHIMENYMNKFNTYNKWHEEDPEL